MLRLTLSPSSTEIWEYFFKRDFPIVAESRAKAAQQREKDNIDEQTGKTPNRRPLKRKSYTDTEISELQDDSDIDDDLFMSYRDLYYDEQVRREERLASAGERLKERMSNLAQIKSSRQTILDPRLSLSLRKRRRGQTLPTGRTHWSKESRPKTLTEKARARASQLAFAYDPPRFTRSASMKVGFIPPKPKPLYKEESLGQAVEKPQVKGIYGPRRGKPSLEDCQAANEAFSRNAKPGPTRVKPTIFVEKTVSRPVKSSIDKPYKILQLPREGISHTRTRPIAASAASHSPKAITTTTTTPTTATVSKPTSSIKHIPGITRRPIPQKQLEEQESQAVKRPETDTTLTPPAITSLLASSPPPSSSALSAPDLPMLSQRPRKLPPGPSLFIPRKKPKVS